MRTVWKYELSLVGEAAQLVSLPEGARVVHVANQDGVLCMWVELDPELPATNERWFRVTGTGHIHDRLGEYVGSALMEPFVWHVYEEGR